MNTTECACRGEYENDDPAWTTEHGLTSCVHHFNSDHAIPDILTGTETFMRLGRQLDNPEFGNNDSPLRQLRRALLEEEYREYDRGENSDDLVEVVDGLLDTIVIAWGTLLAYVGPEKAKAAAREVVRSNLSKVQGEGLPLFREDGKIIKPEGWTAPDIAGAISDD